MADPGRNLRQSSTTSPYSFQLPSFSNLSSSARAGGDFNQDRRALVNADLRPDDLTQSLRQQILVRDQTIAALRNEQNRVQSKCNELETRSRNMDQDISVLMEQRSELSQQVTTRSQEVEGLIRDKEQLQRQSQADAAQWKQIVAMSSRLQVQSMEEKRRFNAEREAWARERERYEHQGPIQQSHGLASSTRVETHISPEAGTFSRPPPATRVSSIETQSQNDLDANTMALRERVTELEGLLARILSEAGNLERAGDTLREARERLTSIPTSSTAQSEPTPQE